MTFNVDLNVSNYLFSENAGNDPKYDKNLIPVTIVASLINRRKFIREWIAKATKHFEAWMKIEMNINEVQGETFSLLAHFHFFFFLCRAVAD